MQSFTGTQAEKDRAEVTLIGSRIAPGLGIGTAWVVGITGTGAPCGLCHRTRKGISITLTRNDDDRHTTLTPEMAHAATTGKHKAQWLVEMHRLQALGAPVDPGDLLQVSRRVTRTSVRRLAGEFFEDGETYQDFAAVSAVDGHELRTEGFTSSILPSVPLGTRGLYRGKKKIQAEVKVMNALLQDRLRTTVAPR